MRQVELDEVVRQLFRELAAKQGRNQSAFADLMEMKRAGFNHAMNGRNSFPLKRLDLYAKAVGLSASEFFKQLAAVAFRMEMEAIGHRTFTGEDGERLTLAEPFASTYTERAPKARLALVAGEDEAKSPRGPGPQRPPSPKRRPPRRKS